MEKISKKEAKERGLKLYFTGKECRNGGVAPRRVSNNQCTCENCKVVKKLHYEKVRHTDKYRESKRQSSSKYYYENKDIHAARVVDWKERNKEFWKWYNDNYRTLYSNTYRDSYERYYKENKHEYVRRCKEYRQRLKRVTPKWYDPSKSKEIYDLADMLRDATGEDWEVDHMIPIKAKKVCGLHWDGNLQVIPATLNRAKGNRMKYTGYLEWLEDYDRTLYSPVSFEVARDGQIKVIKG